ncbi:hypothetical protein AVEN_151254-1 [Araneus ventricosus]|uniref:Uncharacterized protein n=1 Tax=Araneus ventricosus TaxID=182803 RepID=A0A4Y2UYI9_ARAVE|nr:hypothetical protein AVEN_151254-1 [Araneus ventricosus]
MTEIVGLKMHTMVTGNCQQRKFKPIGCDFDGDVVRQRIHPRFPSSCLTGHVLQTFLVSGIAFVLTITEHDSCQCDICFTKRFFSGIGFRIWDPPSPKPRTSLLAQDVPQYCYDISTLLYGIQNIE